MSNKPIFPEAGEKDRIINEARGLGIADETKIRNMEICAEYGELRVCGKCKYEETINRLSEKWFLSFGSIEKIIQNKQ